MSSVGEGKRSGRRMRCHAEIKAMAQEMTQAALFEKSSYTRDLARQMATTLMWVLDDSVALPIDDVITPAANSK